MAYWLIFDIQKNVESTAGEARACQSAFGAGTTDKHEALNKSKERDREVYFSKTLVIQYVKTKMKVAKVIGNFIY